MQLSIWFVAGTAFEIVNSLIAYWDISLVGTIADNASSGLFVVGPARKRVSDFDRLGCKMLLAKPPQYMSRSLADDMARLMTTL